MPERMGRREVLDGVASRYDHGTKSGGLAPTLWTVSVTGTEIDEEGRWLRTLCEMHGDFYFMGDVVSAGGQSYSQELWERLVDDCVAPLDTILYSL